MFYIDRIILERQNDVTNFGLYNIGIKMAGFLFAMGGAMFQAFEPDFYRFSEQKKIKKLLFSIVLVFGVIFLANIIFMIFSKPVVDFLTSGRYTEAYKYANILIWGNYIMQFTYVLSIIIIVKGKTKLLFFNKIFMSIIGVIVFMTFIPSWSFMGAAYAKIVINLIYCLSLLFLIFKTCNLKPLK